MELAVAFTLVVLLLSSAWDLLTAAAVRSSLQHHQSENFWMDRAMMHACKVMDGDDMLTSLSPLHVLVGALGPTWRVHHDSIRWFFLVSFCISANLRIFFNK